MSTGFWTTVTTVTEKKSKVASNVAPESTNSLRSEDDETKKKGDGHENLDYHVDVVIMTAVEDEYVAVRRVFQEIFSEEFASGYKYSLANYEIPNYKKIIVAIFRQNSMGLVAASMTSTYALNKFNPKLLLMCGVCAGIQGKAELGDLIVMSPVYNYGAGKFSAGRFFPDYQQRILDATVRPIIEQMVCDRDLARSIKDAWEHTLGKPSTELAIHLYPGGSGAAVITDEVVIEEIKAHQRTLGAIDMESYAIAEVANAALAKEIPWLVVKGVQDFASPLKNDQYREYCAFCSGLFAKKFLERYFVKYMPETPQTNDSQ